MNSTTKQLLDEINKITKDSPLFYFARDAERALGFENLLDNYYLVCIEKSYLVEQLELALPGKVFCAESQGITLETNSTLELVNNEKVIKWINNITLGKPFYAQLFQFNHPTYAKLQKLGATILNNLPELNRLFEDKLSQYKILNENKIKVPKSLVVNLDEKSFQDLTGEFGSKFVVQLDRAHTGLGTFIIESENEYQNLKTDYDGNLVKVSEFITGEPYTVNGCMTSKGIFVQGLQYQLTGYPELTSGKGSTVGNDWSFGNSLSGELKSLIFDEVKKIGEVMKSKNYKGAFGIDLIVNGNDISIIEINARQTANLAMQTKLEIEQDQIPLMLIHLAEFLELQIDFEPQEKIQPLEGSQIFLRAKLDNFKIGEYTINSGIYRLQSDDSAMNWSFDKIRMKIQGQKLKVIYIDEEKDKPMIWQKEGYSIEQVDDGGFVLLLQNKSSTKNKFDEVARMQFKNQIVYNNKVSPWILEAMLTIENLLR